MGQKWIIDVLADLRAFAQLNGLPLLAADLEATARLAADEIGLGSEGTPAATPVTVVGDGAGPRSISRPAGACGRA